MHSNLEKSNSSSFSVKSFSVFFDVEFIEYLRPREIVLNFSLQVYVCKKKMEILRAERKTENQTQVEQ